MLCEHTQNRRGQGLEERWQQPCHYTSWGEWWTRWRVHYWVSSTSTCHQRFEAWLVKNGDEGLGELFKSAVRESVDELHCDYEMKASFCDKTEQKAKPVLCLHPVTVPLPVGQENSKNFSKYGHTPWLLRGCNGRNQYKPSQPGILLWSNQQYTVEYGSISKHLPGWKPDFPLYHGPGQRGDEGVQLHSQCGTTFQGQRSESSCVRPSAVGVSGTFLSKCHLLTNQTTTTTTTNMILLQGWSSTWLAELVIHYLSFKSKDLSFHLSENDIVVYVSSQLPWM